MRLFHPLIFVLGYIGFVVFALVGDSVVGEHLAFNFYPPVLIYIAIGLLFFSLGTRCAITFPSLNKYLLAGIFFLTTFYSIKLCKFNLGHNIPCIVVGTAFGVLVILLLKYHKKLEEIGQKMLFLGILLLIFDLLYLRDIPLLHPEVRMHALNPLFVLGFPLIVLGINFEIFKRGQRRATLFFMVLSITLLSLFGFRGFLGILVLSTLINAYCNKRIDYKFLFLSATMFGVLMIFLGSVVIAYSIQDWKLNVIELLFYRASFTFGVLNEITRISGMFGITQGGIWSLPIMTNFFISEAILGYEHNITSTIMGPLIFDGGIVELIVVMFFFGIVLNTAYRRIDLDKGMIPYYSMFLATMLVAIEIGTIPMIIIPLLMLLYIANRGKGLKQC